MKFHDRKDYSQTVDPYVGTDFNMEDQVLEPSDEQRMLQLLSTEQLLEELASRSERRHLVPLLDYWRRQGCPPEVLAAVKEWAEQPVVEPWMLARWTGQEDAAE